MRNRWPLHCHPTRAAVLSLTRPAQSKVTAQASIPQDRLRACLQQHGANHDALAIFRFVVVTRFLKNVKFLKDASSAVVRALWPKKSQRLLDELLQDGWVWPSKWHLAAARPRIDMVCMIFERKYWSIGKFAGEDRSLHLYVDSSPNSGRDVFGICIDIFIHGQLAAHRILPPVCLGHGYSTALDKTMALLWSIYLICGTMDVMEKFLQDVRSISTDFGVESRIPFTPNVLEHFASYVGLKISASFRLHQWLFPFCVIIPDWNHIVANMLKFAFSQLERWPLLLDMIRSVCSFLKIAEYRDVIRQQLEESGRRDLADLLKHFSVSIATWRYQTMVVVFAKLLKIRELCEVYFDPAWMGNVKDQSLLAKFDKACKCEALWRFIVKFPQQR